MVNLTIESTRKINKILLSMIKFIEISLIISILLFCYFLIKGLLILGHIPCSGDQEVISNFGFDRKIVIVMLYPMFYGILLWMIFMVCGMILKVRRTRRAFIIGLILCILNILIMLSSQLAWIMD